MIARTVSAYERDVDAFARSIVSGGQVAGELERAACQRYLDDYLAIMCGESDYWFDYDDAILIIDFFSSLKHTSSIWAGRHFIPEPFQKFILWNLYGFKRTADNTRRFREAFISFARGNGKSPLAAGILVHAASIDRVRNKDGDPIREYSAECYSVATKRDQAKIVFTYCQRFIETSDYLSPRFKVGKTNIFNPNDFAKIEPLGSDSKNSDGLVIQCLVKDELHAWRPRHVELQEKLETALGKRPQPLSVTITTAGDEDSDLWQNEYDYSRDVVNGVVPAESHFSYICEIDDGDDPLDESVWPKANPLLAAGVVQIDHLRRMSEKAKRRRDKKTEFTRYHCNKRVTSTSKLIDRDVWKACNGEFPDDVSQLACYGGFDWGWQDDLAAFGWVWVLDPIQVGGEWKPVYAIGCDVFIPRGTKRDLNREPWINWIENGLLTVTESEHTDPYVVFQRCQERDEEYVIQSIAYDKNNCDAFVTRVVNELGIEMTQFPQTVPSFNAPTREFLKAIAERRIVHGGNSILGWCAENVIGRYSPCGQYLMPSKKHSRDKIDPIVAVIMALGEAIYHQEQGFEAGSLSL